MASSGNDDDNARKKEHTTALRQRRQKPKENAHQRLLSRQQQLMLRQMRAQNRHDRAARNILKTHHTAALGDLLIGYFKTLLLLCLLGGGLLLYVDPQLTVVFGRPKTRLPPRKLWALYNAIDHSNDSSDSSSIWQQLPRVVGHYARVTPENLPARQAIKCMVQLRRWATQLPLELQRKYKQSITVRALERPQLVVQTMDDESFCASRTKNAHELLEQKKKNLPVFVQTTLIQWCGLLSGRADGYLGNGGGSGAGTLELHAPIVRGTQGTVVIAKTGTDHADWAWGAPGITVDPSAVMILPILNATQLQRSSTTTTTSTNATRPTAIQPPPPPSTTLPPHAVDWLIQHIAATDFDHAPPRAFSQAFGVFLTQQILLELEKFDDDRWSTLRAACNPEQMQQIMDNGWRKVGRQCHGLQEEEEEPDTDNTDEDRRCCDIFGPTW